jgi:hypothetical protein
MPFSFQAGKEKLIADWLLVAHAQGSLTLGPERSEHDAEK